MTYTNEVVIVTGGAGFIGGAICAALAADGAALSVVDIDAGKLRAKAQGWRDAGARVAEFVGDVRRPPDVAAMVQHAYDTYGRADFLVNVAAIAPVTPFLEVTKDEWDAVMETNLDSIFMLCQAFARA